MSEQDGGTIANILKIVAFTAEFAARAKANHDAAIDLARQAGISPAQISGATSLWTQTVTDPLATRTLGSPITTGSSSTRLGYRVAFDGPKTDDELKALDYNTGDEVISHWQVTDRWMVIQPDDDIPAQWKPHHTII